MMERKLIDIDGLRTLVRQIDALTGTSITKKIANVIGEDSTNELIPGALAVYEFVMGLIKDEHTVCVEVVDDLPETGKPNVIYIDKPEDGSAYDMYLYNNGSWVGLGKMEVNLSNYWSTDELTIMTNEEVLAVLNGDDE